MNEKKRGESDNLLLQGESGVTYTSKKETRSFPGKEPEKRKKGGNLLCWGGFLLSSKEARQRGLEKRRRES